MSIKKGNRKRKFYAGHTEGRYWWIGFGCQDFKAINATVKAMRKS